MKKGRMKLTKKKKMKMWKSYIKRYYYLNFKWRRQLGV